MKKTLKFVEEKSKSGIENQLMIFLHGYGANGADLLSISNSLKNYFPDMTFLAPNAPFNCLGIPGGYKWFDLPWLDGSQEVDLERTFNQSIEIFNEWLTYQINLREVEDKNVYFFGFSQGTMLSFHSATMREKCLGGVLGFSGKLIKSEMFKDRIKSKCPFLLVHGDQDEVVPYQNSQYAYKFLKENKFNVDFIITKGVGHGISPEGLQVALTFLNKFLNKIK